MGEKKRKLNSLVVATHQAIETMQENTAAMSVVTPGGRIQVQWDENASATAMGQLSFFAEFLEVSGLFKGWCDGCPLNYTSSNAPEVIDVLGTWMLGILDGHHRYAHIAALRGDGLAPRILGMNKVIGDDSLRRALAQIAPASNARHNEAQRQAQEAQLARALAWMQEQLRVSTEEALSTPWILDCDTTVKVLYGHQSGAVVAYNPRKPGRPSHSVHTYWMGNLRLVLDAQVQAGNRHHASHGLPGLKALIERLPVGQRPRLVRGDCDFGNEGIMGELEALGQPYLFKLRKSAGVKRLVQRHWNRSQWVEVGQGMSVCEDRLRLSGWSQARRVVLVRQAARGEALLEKKGKRLAQSQLQFIDTNEPVKLWDYAVLVCNTSYELSALGQLYRDRADCENGFDELKNQWGWGGYTTQDIERCDLSAKAVALIYNWWSWYVRLAHPKARLEAITSRPKLLAAVGRVTEHAGSTRVLLTVTHAASAQIRALVANVRAGLAHVRAIAPQLTPVNLWRALVRYIVDKIMRARAHPPPSPLALLTG